MMAGLGNKRYSIIQTCVLLMFLIVVQVTGQVSEENCGEIKCPGPLRYYKALGCTPIYVNPDDNCAEAYDCSHLDDWSRDKCYVNGHEYSVGETLRPEDSNPCDRNCTCTHSNNDANFACAKRKTCDRVEEESCLYRRAHGLCCDDPFCDIGKSDATCNVDGKVYRAGQFFNPNSNPKLMCVCLDGYTGENIEPFCQEMKHDPCSPMFADDADKVHDKYTPIWFTRANFICPIPFYRYPESSDAIIRKHDSTSFVSEKESRMCQHGNVMLHIGDELSLDQPSNHMVNHPLVTCVCEVPPVVTCKKVKEQVFHFVSDL
ncbi:uncharacterized protein isoform X2 [Bombus fervidus]|uniref:uncharacterized protein isoform X2 n=1 Tax=Bombus fervidus TaxID=203811 RepID=UPI003AB4F418